MILQYVGVFASYNLDDSNDGGWKGQGVWH